MVDRLSPRLCCCPVSVHDLGIIPEPVVTSSKLPPTNASRWPHLVFTIVALDGVPTRCPACYESHRYTCHASGYVVGITFPRRTSVEVLGLLFLRHSIRVTLFRIKPKVVYAMVLMFHGEPMSPEMSSVCRVGTTLSRSTIRTRYVGQFLSLIFYHDVELRCFAFTDTPSSAIEVLPQHGCAVEENNLAGVVTGF